MENDTTNSSVEMVYVTPEMAAAWMETSRYHAQRRISQAVVNRYAEEMSRGEWGIPDSNIVFGIRPSGKHMLNGWHRLSAVVKSGTGHTFSVMHRTFDSEYAMDKAYGLMDQHTKRPFALGLAALGTAEAVGITPSDMEKVNAAMVCIANNFDNRGAHSKNAMMISTAEERHRLIMSLCGPVYSAIQMSHMAGKKRSRMFHRASVLAVAIVTYRFAPAQAIEFWQPVAENDSLKKGSPQHTLRGVLEVYNINEKGMPWYSRAVAQCWNAYREGRQLTFVRPVTTTPITIRGTPWNGKDVDPYAALAERRYDLTHLEGMK